MSISRNATGDALYPAAHENKVAEDTNFVVGDSPVTIDVNGTIKRNANQGFIVNDGPGDIQYQWSSNGTVYSTIATLKAGETFDLEGMGINSIKLTWVSDSSYRVMAF